MHTLAYTHQANPRPSWASALGLHTKGFSVGVQSRLDPLPSSNERTNDLLRTNALHHSKFHCTRPNDVREKRYKFFTPFSILALQGTPGLKFTSLDPDVQQGPLYQTAKFRMALKTLLQYICCMGLVNFIDSVTNTHKQ